MFATYKNGKKNGSAFQIFLDGTKKSLTFSDDNLKTPTCLFDQPADTKGDKIFSFSDQLTY
jgi:hypothetical protein